jgi:rhamnogalacturonyl hydrolase YesR
MLVAATELLRELPQNFQGRDSIVHLVQNHVRGLTAHQDTATGLWRQVIDKRESYLETSCSAMFVYTLATGINNGWLDSSYAGAARRGWEGIAARITPEGHILGTCAGTSIGDSLQFYYDRPTPENDPHAFGPVLLAASAMKQLK